MNICTNLKYRIGLFDQALSRKTNFSKKLLLDSSQRFKRDIYTNVVRPSSHSLVKSGLGKEGGGLMNCSGIMKWIMGDAKVLKNTQKRNFQSLFGGRKAPTTKQLKILERDANLYPEDVNRQLPFIRALNQDYPKLVVQRIQTGQFAASEEINKEYLKALVRTGLIENVQTAQVVKSMQSNPQTFNTFEASSQMQSKQYSIGAQPDKPMFVSMVGGGFKSSVYKSVKFIILGLLSITFLGTVLEEKSGIGNRMGGNRSGVQPVGSEKRFDDVQGVDEAKEQLQEIVQYLKDPLKFTRLGGKLPKGVMLMGPPGTGKTLLARAIAGEAGVPFFYACGSEFEEMYVGVGARRVRDLFEAAKRKSPCIVFIDEIDAIGGNRKLKDQSAMKMTLNQLLVELDGFEQNNGVIVIAATNFPQVLDKALIRPGRFDRHINVPLPDVAGRKQILDLYTKNLPLHDNVDIERLARVLVGVSGAMLSNLVNEAALRASALGRTLIDMDAFEFAKDKILMGPERRSAVISPENMKITAYHEGGHALVAMLTPGAHPVYKVTIMPRGQALGMVTQLPEGDQVSISKKQLLASLDVCMGGRVAEELIFGPDEITGGASSDIEKATYYANLMVTKYGMSDEIGPVFHDDSKNSSSSPVTKKIIDDEIRKICDASYKRAQNLLTSHRQELEKIAKALIEYETLTGHEIQKILKGEKIDRKN